MYRTTTIHKQCGKPLRVPHPRMANISADNSGNALIECYCEHCKILVNLDISEYRDAWLSRILNKKQQQKRRTLRAGAEGGA